jgi:hypothetical protein
MYPFPRLLEAKEDTRRKGHDGSKQMDIEDGSYDDRGRLCSALFHQDRQKSIPGQTSGGFSYTQNPEWCHVTQSERQMISSFLEEGRFELV